MSSPEPLPREEPGPGSSPRSTSSPRRFAVCSSTENEFARVAAAARQGRSLVRFVGHGSSDNAATYGVYAFGLLAGWTALRDSITLTVYYGAEVDVSGSIVLGLSQSGRTPDVVAYLERARAGGAFTVAVTNDPGSEMARAAEAVLPLGAGDELAVAATKTYVNQLAALALLAAHIGGKGPRIAEAIRDAADRLENALPALDAKTQELAVPFSYVGRMFVIGRGAEYATAREIALKLLETCRTAAAPSPPRPRARSGGRTRSTVSGVGDRSHGDVSLSAVQEAASRIKEFGSTVVASEARAREIAGADCYLPVPEPEPALLSPLLSVVPGQLFAAALARVQRASTPTPRAACTKVTLALAVPPRTASTLTHRGASVAQLGERRLPSRRSPVRSRYAPPSGRSLFAGNSFNLPIRHFV